MTEESTYNQKVFLAGSLLSAASAVVILAGLKAAQGLVTPFFLAAFFAVVLIPPLAWLRSKGFSEFVSFLIVAATAFFLGIASIWILAASVNMFVQKTPHYRAKIETVRSAAETFLAKHGLSLGAAQPEQEALRPINTSVIFAYTQWAVSEISKTLTVALLVLIMMTFMIFEAARLPKKLLMAFGSQGFTNEKFQAISDKVWHYTKIKTLISLATGIVTAIFLLFMGVEYALLWGLFAFLFNYVPNIGSIVASVPPIALAFLDIGISSGIIVTIALIIINWVIGYYFEPRYLGEGLGISPLIVLLSLIFWGWLFGIIGMFLSAPLTIVLKIVLDTYDDTRWLGILMED